MDYETLALENRVTVTVGSTAYEELDPQNGEKLILRFSYETPHVSIQGREEAAGRINDYLAMLDETFYTGNDYGAGAATGFNAMLEFAQDQYGYIVSQGEEYEEQYCFSATRTVSVARADEQVLSLWYDDYYYTGGTRGSQEDKGFVFDAQTGEKLQLEDLSGEGEAFSAWLTETMLGLIDADPDYYGRIELETAKTTLGAEDLEGVCRALQREDSWYLDMDGLVLFSGQNEIGTGVDGDVEFHIPYEQLRDHVDSRWLPGDRSAPGHFVLTPMDQVEDGSVEIIDLLTADEDGESYCLLAEGAVYDVRISRVQYATGFYGTAQLWSASHMSGCALQLQAALPEGMPELMISYTAGGERHSVLLSQDETGSAALVDDSIEAVG